MDAMTCTTLIHYRLWNVLPFFDEELGFWVKPRFTTWFSRFLLHEYNDSHWVQLFRLTEEVYILFSDASITYDSEGHEVSTCHSYINAIGLHFVQAQSWNVPSGL